MLETWHAGLHASVVHRSSGDRRLGVVCACSVAASRTARIAVSGVQSPLWHCKALRFGVRLDQFVKDDSCATEYI